MLVPDVAGACGFFTDVLRLESRPGPWPGSGVIGLGKRHEFVYRGHGRTLPVISDRWEHGGLIPILRTYSLDRVVRTLDAGGVTWINEIFEYHQPAGTGRLAYFHGPGNQPIGLQERLADSSREEDVEFQREVSSYPGGASTGIYDVGWVILQTVDLMRMKEFYVSAFGWPERRGTAGFGNMMTMGDCVMLQTAKRGRPKAAGRDLSKDAVLPILRGNVDRVMRRVGRAGGREGPQVCGMRSILDPEGNAWLFTAKQSV